MLENSDSELLLELAGDQNGTIAAIWEAHQIMRDKEDFLDNLRVYLKVAKEQRVNVEQPVEETERLSISPAATNQMSNDEAKVEKPRSVDPPQKPTQQETGGGGFIKL